MEITNEPILIVYIRPDISYLFLWPSAAIFGQLVFNLRHGI
jgi:hypothetical protein